MTKYAVDFDGPTDAVERTKIRIKREHGGDNPLEALVNFIKEKKFQDVLAVAVESGKVVIEAAEDAIDRIIASICERVHQLFHQKVDVVIV